MKKAQPPKKEKPGQVTQADYTATSKFTGTSNPRELRLIHTLLRGPTRRETLDREVGCSNAPDLIHRVRKKGLEIPCERVEITDRDGQMCRPGIYYFTPRDRRIVSAWLERRGGAI